METFHGRPVIAGDFAGEAVVSHGGLNILASFQKSALAKSKKLICSDQNNRDLYGKNLTGKVVCLPQTIGSTTGGMVLQTVCRMGIAPAALLFSGPIDSLAAAGVLLCDIWLNRKIFTVDRLGDGFLEKVKDGANITIRPDGTVSF